MPSRDRPSSGGGVPGPVAFPELLKSSWRLYRSNFRSLFVLFLPLGATFFLALIPLLFLRASDVVVARGASVGASISLALLTVLPVVAGAIVVAVAAPLLTERLVGRSASLADAFRQVRPVLGAVFAAGLAAALLSILLQLLAYPFAFFVHPLLYGPAVVAQVIALEGGDLRAALSRAGRLLQGEKLRLFMYLFAPAMAVSLLERLLPYLAGAAVAGAAGDAVGFAGFTLVQIVVTALLIPYIAAADLVAYFDLRARKESLDLPALAAERRER